MALLQGTTFGPYEILASLGAGGMGEVYRARDTRLGREVALKVLSPSTFADAVRRARFIKEAQTAGGLNHPNIASVYDVNLESTRPYIVSELVPGESLRAMIKRGPVPRNALLDIAVQIAFGLSAAHKAGVVHRDLKPENILITPEGVVKIIDFGLAKSGVGQMPTASEAATLTTEGMVIGTVSYMSPEQASGREIDHRCDVFAFGLVLYELASGHHPFPRDTAVEQMAAIIREEAAPIEQPLPNSLLLTIERCLAKDPAQRWQSTQDLYVSLRDQRDHLLDSTAMVQRRVHTPPSQPSKTWRWLGPVAAALGAILLVGLLFDPAGAPDAAMRFTPLATGPEVEDGADWSPKGDAIAYHATVDGVRQVFVLGLTSDSPVQITRCVADCDFPKWSPDGGRVYFHTRGTIAVVGAAGGEPQVLAQGGGEYAISPDGRTLIFRRNETNPPGFSLWVSSPPGAPPKRYTPAPFEGSSLGGRILMDFAPDGKSLVFWAYVSDLKRGPEMWSLPMPPGSAPPTQILSPAVSPVLLRGLSWMPDGRRLVVAATTEPDTFRTHLQMFDVKTREVRPLVNTIGIEATPAVSPDGRRIAHTVMGIDTDIVELPLDGSPVRAVISTSRFERSPVWHPTVPEFAYVSDRRGTEEIWIRTTVPKRDRPVVVQSSFPDRQARFLNSPAFSPDGERIAFVRGGAAQSTSQGVEIWVAGVAGGALARLTDAQGGNQWSPTWSPDGNWIAYFESTTKRLMKARVGAGSVPETLIACPQGAECLPEWSPRGDWIAFRGGRNGTMLVSPDGKQTRVLRADPYLAIAWSRDADTVFGLASQNGRLQLYSMDVATGRERLLNSFGPDLSLDAIYSAGLRVSLSPDGKALLAAKRTFTADLWMLEDFYVEATPLNRLLRLFRHLLSSVR